MTLAALVPGCAVAERGGDAPPPLWPDEEVALGTVAAARRREFAAGRACARAALAALGLPATAIGRGPDRAPRWPAGVVGSITHTDGYAAAAVGRADAWLAIGVDAEPHAPLPAEVRPQVITAAEAAALAAAPVGTCWDRVLFSAKESVYKAWSPVAGSWLDFADVTVTVDVAGGCWRAAIARPGPWATVAGRFAIAGGRVLTAVAVARSPAPG